MKATLIIVSFFILSFSAKAQSISVDVAAVHNYTQKLSGANFSVFYHFIELFSAGVEVNRFFPRNRYNENEALRLSAWDFDFNLHYYLPVHKKLFVYPVLGVGYSSEKEEKETSSNRHHIKYFNAGAGILLNTKIIKPHIEYVIASSRKTEQFALAGITIEIDFKK